MSFTVKRELTFSEPEECWGSSRTLRVTADTQRQGRIASTIRKECKEPCLTARHKCALQGRGSENSHQSNRLVSDDRYRDLAIRRRPPREILQAVALQ